MDVHRNTNIGKLILKSFDTNQYLSENKATFTLLDIYTFLYIYLISTPFYTST